MLSSIKYLSELTFAFPDILSAIFAIVMMVYRSVTSESVFQRHASKLSFAFLIACITVSVGYRGISQKGFESSLFIYNLNLLELKLGLFTAVLIVMLILKLTKFSNLFSSGIYIFIWGLIISINLCISSNSFLTLLLGFELYTFSVVFALLMEKTENALQLKSCVIRFLLLSSVMSGVFLFGCSLLYGQFGALSFKITPSKNFEYIVGTLLICSYVIFKLGLSPFHTWIVDIYDKASYSIVMFLDIVWKLFLGFIFLKVFFVLILDISQVYKLFFSFIAILSMVIGTLLPFFQSNIKKFIATAAIAHLGFVFTTFTLGQNMEFASSVMSYLFYYSISSICFFTGILTINKNYPIKKFSDLTGIMSAEPLLGSLVLLSLFAIIGLPPFGNFIAKLNIFRLLLENKAYLLLVVSGLYSVFSVLYVVKVSKYMFKAKNDTISHSNSSRVLPFFMLVVLIFSGIFYTQVEKINQHIENKIQL